MKDPFLKPRLTGSRFDGHAIPLEFLKDLAVLEEMIVEVAKWKYLEANPERQRVLRGFAKGIELKLTEVEDGSAQLIIVLCLASSCFIPPADQEYFEKSRDAIICAIEEAEENRPITALPQICLGFFDRLGRGLRPGEAMEFSKLKPGEKARLTRETRQRLIQASNAKEYTQQVSIYGFIPEANQGNMSFQFQLNDGHKVKAPILAQHLDSIIIAFADFKKGAKIQLEGIGRFTPQGKIKEIESVEHITLLNPLDVPARLDEFHGLQDGWLEGKGIAPNDTGLDWLAETFEQNFPDDLQLPYLYPTESGGIQAEWPLGKNEITLEINLLSKKGDWHCLNMESDEENLKNIDLAEKEDWQWLAEQIRTMAGSVA